MNERTWPRTASSNGSNQSLAANGDGAAGTVGVASLHGVGSFPILPTGTYAASSNFHQPRDTTRLPVLITDSGWPLERRAGYQVHGS